MHHSESIDRLLLFNALCSVTLLTLASFEPAFDCAEESAAIRSNSRSASNVTASISPIIISQLDTRRRKGCRNNDDGVSAIYARYSSDQQDEKSITDQVRSCRAHATGKNMLLNDDAIYKDEAVSGTLRHREGLDRLLADAAAGRIRVIYFYNLSRLARDSVITKTVMRQLVDLYRVRIITVVENIDSNVNGWDTIASMFGIVHEQFITFLREAVRNGQIGTVEGNKYSVGDWRFGYTSVPSPDGKTIRRAGIEVPRRIYQIKEDEAEWVRRIFCWFVLEFRSIQWIVRELNQNRVPKGHRSTSAKWDHQRVISILRSPKYVGIWPWGEHENVRDPVSGRVTQVQRAKSECEKWVRDREDLRIIDNDRFIEAQERLDENARLMESFRDEKGRLRGSDGSCHRVQLLTGLMICPVCGHKFYVTGAHGDYLQCCGARDGACGCKTMLPRRVAEKLILEHVGHRLRHDSEWQNAVHRRAVEFWHELRRQNPNTVEELQRSLQILDAKIKRLLDVLEEERLDPDIRQRLEERRRERYEVLRELERLQAQDQEMPTPPLCEWVATQLQELHEVLQGNVAAANRALLQLLDGSFRLELIEEEGRKRKFWRGSFRIQSLEFSKLPVSFPTDEADNSANSEIVLDFRNLPREKTQVQRAWQLVQEGNSFTEIAKELGVKKSRCTGIMKIVARRFGNGLSAKELKAKFNDQRPPSEPYRQFIEPAMALFNQGLLYDDIADQLKTHRKAISWAIGTWHAERGLEVPDGRTRRISLEFKGQPRKSQSSDPTDETPVVPPPEAEAA